jgi:flagellar FliJ protein
MSPRKSRLSTLLRVRRIQEEISRGRLVAETVAERGTRLSLDQAHAQYAEPAGNGLSGDDSEPQSTEGFVAHQFHRGALAGAVRTALTNVEAAEQITVLARRDWSASALRMAALERLDDRAREAARHELLAAEQRTSEESSTSKLERDPTKVVRGAKS